MKNAAEGLEMFLFLFSMTVILLGLAGFIIYFIVLYRRKQIHNEISRESLKLHYESELLKTRIEVQEQTMQTIAADLHDNIGQLLSLTILTISSIDSENAQQSSEKIKIVTDLARRSISELRQLAKLMNGNQLLKYGLDHAISQELDYVNKTGKYHLSFNLQPDLPELDPNRQLIIFRIFQEILNNIIKHAEATEITVTLEKRENALLLQVVDNGIGFEPDALFPQRGMGLENLKRRVDMLGGRTDISSNRGKGTHIDILIPGESEELK